jgi:hypothetical protein
MTDRTTHLPGNAVGVEAVIMQAQPVLDAFCDAVVACGREPPFKPTILVAGTSEATRYDPASRAVILVPYEVLQPVSSFSDGSFCGDWHTRLVRIRTIYGSLQ